MIPPKVSDVIGIINKIAPFERAEEWDNVGLQTGDPAGAASRILVALDAGPEAIEGAVAHRCQLLLTHHPFIFKPLKKISLADPQGRLLALAIKNDLAVIALHTNFDVATGGVNDLLAKLLGMESWEPLKATHREEMIKLSVFVPKGNEEEVTAALYRFTGAIGNYRDCSFRSPGVGTFTPLAGARPFTGEVGKREYVEETRVEVLLRKGDLRAAVTALKKAHPYEEPAYDLYPLLNTGEVAGLGRIGSLGEETTLGDLAGVVKRKLGAEGVRYVGPPARPVRRVAVCGGSGAFLLRDALKQGADVLVTGDVKYHEARDAEALGLALIDAGHFATERPMVGGLVALLTEELANRRFAAEVLAFEGEREPFRFM